MKDKTVSEIKRYDRAWVFTFFGTAIGSGILFIPLQTGISGLYVSVITMFLAFSVTYFAQKYYTIMLAKADNAHSFNEVIEEFLGKGFSTFISIFFAMQLFATVLVYSTGLNTNIGEFMFSNKITGSNIASNPLLPLVIIVVLALIMTTSPKLLVRFLDKMTFVLIFLIVVMAVLFIPFWNVVDFTRFNPDMHFNLKNAFMSFPLYMGAINFYPALSPMLIFYRKNYPGMTDKEREVKAFTLNKMAIYLLGFFTAMFVLSAAMTLTPESIKYASEQNISILAVVGFGMKATTVLSIIKFLSYFVIFFALTTSFYGIMLGLVEILAAQFFPKNWNDKLKRVISIFGLVVLLWLFTVVNLNIIGLLGLVTTPCTGITLFVIPTFIVLTNKKFKENRSISTFIILVIGVFIVFSFLLGLLMG